MRARRFRPTFASTRSVSRVHWHKRVPKWHILVLFLALALGVGGVTAPRPAQAARREAILAPILKWAYKGCYSSWCETGWYASPAAIDLDEDGVVEVIGAADSLFVLDGATGNEERRIAPPADGARTWPGVVVADLEQDGDLEVVTAHGGGYVRVLDHAGNVLWTRKPSTHELRGLSVYDLDGDRSLEIVVTAAVDSETNTWVYEHDGTPRGGWPQLAGDRGYAYGVFNDNAALADLDGDGQGEIIVPSDVHYICAYEANGVQIPAHTMYGGKLWSEVGVWESLATELRGWGECDAAYERAERYRANFAHGPASVADLNADGAVEVVVVGNVYDCAYGHPPGKYNGVYVFNADRSRFAAWPYNWETVPLDTGAPLSEDYDVIENAQPNPVLADLDGDGEREILFASYDGRMHAFWLDKTGWVYSVYQPAEGFYRFASEPAVVDLDGDGRAEVIFASWTEKGSGRTGKLHILSSQGALLHEVDLPAARGDATWNGALAAPTVADIDGDVDLEVVLNTAHSGLVAYDLPGTANAEVQWGTGRGNMQRSGSILRGTLAPSTKTAYPLRSGPGDIVTYTLALRNPGPDLLTVRMTDVLPPQVNYPALLHASSGTLKLSGGVVIWTGQVLAGAPVTIIYRVRVRSDVTLPTAIVNTAVLEDEHGQVWLKSAITLANGHTVHLPVLFK